MMRQMYVLAALSLGFALGCSDDAPTTPTPDAGMANDAEAPDTGAAPDTGPTADAGTPDTGMMAATGFDVPGFSAPVDVVFDALGVPSLRCTTDLDCFRAQGYLHAYHRFGQMDLRRRAVKGELAQLAGAAAVDTDVQARAFFATRSGASVAQQLLDSSSAETRAMLTAYAEGVNAWLADLRAGRNGAQLTPEWSAYAAVVGDWAPLDSLACILALIEQLTNQTGSEISRGTLFAQLPPALAIDLYGVRPSHPATVIPAGNTVRDLEAILPAARELRAQLWPFRSVLAKAEVYGGKEIRTGDSGKGSNNWVVGPAQAAGQEALLANDPHLGMTTPSVWFVMNIQSEEGLRIAGASFAGLPAIILGQNENIAWGATTTFFDMADVYLEQLSTDGTGVVFNGQTVPFVPRSVTIEVARGEPVTRNLLYVPHHGPVVSIDPAAGTAVTIKWTGQDADTDGEFLLGMAKATSVAEAKMALRNVTTLGQNFVVADRQGNIGWFPYNRLPSRPWASARRPSWLPLPGDGSAEWMGTLPLEQVPQAENPPEGYIATANNDMTGSSFDGDPTNDGRPMLQHFPASGYRQAQILNRLSAAAGTHDRASMQSIQADVRSAIGAEMVPAILAAVDGQMLTPSAQTVADALRAWDFECPTGLDGNTPDAPAVASASVRASAAGCTAFHVLYPRLVNGIFGDEVQQAGVTNRVGNSALTDIFVRPGRLLGGVAYFDNVTTRVTETPAMTVSQALAATGDWLTMNAGASVDDWMWGRLHTLTLRADLFDAVGITVFNEGPYANDGGLFTVDVANPVRAFSDDYSQFSGASMRFACAAGTTGVNCTMELPGGQATFADSPTPSDTLTGYLRNEPFDLPFDPASIDGTAVRRWTLSTP